MGETYSKVMAEKAALQDKDKSMVKTHHVELRQRFPIFKTPLLKLGQEWYTLQDTKCAAFEMDYYRCASRVGEKQEEEHCWKYKEDLRECITRKKSNQRYILLQRERKLQGKPYKDPPYRDISQADRDKFY